MRFHLYNTILLHNDDTVGKRSSKFWIDSMFKYTFHPTKAVHESLLPLHHAGEIVIIGVYPS